MDNQVYTYALVKSFYDAGKDYIDCFAPFVAQALSEGAAAHLADIQASIKQRAGITIPQYTLKTILRRSKKRGYVDSLGHGQYKITERGSRLLESLDTQEVVQRKLDALSSNFSLFLTSRSDISIDTTEAFILLRKFIESNLLVALDYLNPSIEQPSHESSVLCAREDINIIDYIEHIRRHSSEYYNTLREIILGCTLSIVLFCPDISSIKEKFKGTTLFLDSNFVFNVLGFHYDEFAAPAKELFQMLKKYGFRIKIFHTTVDEICHVIHRFPVYENIYASNVRVASIYSKLKTKGWTSSDSRDFILSIEDKLSELGIQLETLEDIDITSYNPPVEELRTILAQYKPAQLRASQNHDLIAIEQVIKRRRHSVRNIQHAKAFFLTSDFKLAKFNFEQFGHKTNCTVCEVIPDFLLANFLWLQDPQSSLEMPLKLLIAAHSQHLFVERKVWQRFVDVLRELKDDNCISDEKTATLLYHGRVEELLRTLDQSDCDVITREFVITEIEKAAADIDDKIAAKLKEKEADVRALFEQELSHQKIQRNQEWLTRVTTIKANLRKSAMRRASWWAFLISAFACIAILGAVATLLCFGLKRCDKEQTSSFLMIVILGVSLFIGTGGIVTLCPDLYRFLKSIFSQRLSMKKLKEAGLEIDA